jgi:uncharacterized low-complexity protein
MNRILDKLTYANVVATLALFVALGGASYAATQLPRNSVGTKQLKKNAVTAQKIAKGAVTKAKLGADAQAALTGPAGPAGLTGPKGDAGPRGETGAPGPNEAFTTEAPDETVVGTTATEIASMTLPAGQWLLFGDLTPEGSSGEPNAICYWPVGGAVRHTFRTQLVAGKLEGLVVIEPMSLTAPTEVSLICEANTGSFTIYGELTTVAALRVGALR